MKMKAAVLHSTPSELSIEEVNIKEPAPGEVRIKIAASGLCHTDWETMKGFQSQALPAVIGHEGAGIVESIGDGVTRLKPGDHVVCSWEPNCGHCFYCDNGQPILCEPMTKVRTKGLLYDENPRMFIGDKPVYHYSMVSSHAEYTVIPEQGAVPVREDFPLDRAALLGCAVMTGYGGAVYAGKIRPESSVAVVGCGAVGLSAIQGARLSGASTIIAIDINSDKLKVAADMGATHTFNSLDEEPSSFVKDLTAGRGVDCAIEAAGQNISIKHTLEISRPGARIVLLGKTPFGEEISLPFHLLMGDREIIRTSYGMSRPRIDFPKLANLYMNERLMLDEMISMRLKLEEINKGFEHLEQGKVARAIVVFD
ncbi:MAG: Zn-dependent alcohol dehydrogenase [SAR202 cluster bacterium]|nr:Zn-dependent alcohol dehydrogenase [SAR202 cluster bacterium]|tara:strand:+ start:2788 stop:3891 length:1104 start_codon:yes stop_codon:yes gene_type:complete